MRPIDADYLINRMRDRTIDNPYELGDPLRDLYILDGMTFIAMINESPTVDLDAVFEDDLK